MVQPDEPRVSSKEAYDFFDERVRAAFEKAAKDTGGWERALADGRGYLEAGGIEVPDSIGVTFLEESRDGDWIVYSGAGGQRLFQMYCPPVKVWWNQCRKIIRVCDRVPVMVNGQVEWIEKNCHFVCEQWIWEQSLALPKRPPFPPLPLL